MITNYRPDHNGIGQLLRSQEMRSMVREVAETAESLYRGRVTKRTGRLARDTRILTIPNAGLKRDRWHAQVIAMAPYSAIHEFDRQSVDGHRRVGGAHDWQAVLAQMGSLP